MIKKVFLSILLLSGVYTGWSQTFLDWQLHDRYFSIYAGTGWSGYIGELSNGHPFSEGLSHFNIGLEARLYTKLGARVQIAQYRLEGSDSFASDSSFNRQRNLSFYSRNYEWQLQGVYYFLKYRKKYHKRRTYEPYFAFGVGQTFYNPKADHTVNDVTTSYTLRDIGTEGESYKKFAWIIPLNLGVKAALNEFLNLSLDVGYRYAFTPYLDDVSNNYGGPFDDGTIEASLSNRKYEVGIINQEAYDALVPGETRGNGKNDSYFLINLNIELYLPRDLFRGKNGKNKKEKILGKPSAYD
jgi:hypothetical protein